MSNTYRKSNTGRVPRPCASCRAALNASFQLDLIGMFRTLAGMRIPGLAGIAVCKKRSRLDARFKISGRKWKGNPMAKIWVQCAVALMLLTTWNSSVPQLAGAEATQQWLTVRFVVCPLGDDRDLAACERRVAHDLLVSVRPEGPTDFGIKNAVPDANGDVYLNVTGMSPARFIVNGGPTIGNDRVACRSEEGDAPAEFVSGYHASAIFSVDVPERGDVSCIFYLSGNARDVERYDIVETVASGDETPEVTIRVFQCQFIGGCQPGSGYRLSVQGIAFEPADDLGFFLQSLDGVIPGIVSIRGLPQENWQRLNYKSEISCSSLTGTLEITVPDSGFAGDTFNVTATDDSDIRCDLFVTLTSDS